MAFELLSDKGHAIMNNNEHKFTNTKSQENQYIPPYNDAFVQFMFVTP